MSELNSVVQAKLKYARISAQKMRLVINQIRNLQVEKAMNYLEFSNKKAAKIIRKTLKSAIANAEHNNALDIDNLYINSIYADAGPTIKRFEARAKGKGNRILKRSSHLTIKLHEIN